VTHPARPSRNQTTGRILALAWPLLVGQLAVVAHGMIDSAMAGQISPVALASIAIGSSVYAVVYVCLLGTLQAMAPIIASDCGAGEPAAVGETWRQGRWLGIALLVPGAALLLNPWPLLNLASPEAAVAEGATQYLRLLALGLPAALWFRLFTILNIALARPRVVMAINLLGPFLKIPLNTLFINGTAPLPWAGDLALPAWGAAGCGLATAAVSWLCAVLGWLMLRYDRFYTAFQLAGWSRPRRAALATLMRLGLPIGITYLIDVTAFSLMTLLMTRFGTLTVSAHAIAANLAVTLYMIPVALGSATSIMAAQALGAGRTQHARHIAGHGLALTTVIAWATGAVLWATRQGVAERYTSDPHVVAVAVPLIAVVALYHMVDALQCTLSFVLRAWRITFAPMLVFAVALWGIGLGGGWFAATEMGWGAAGFWWAASAALATAATALGVFTMYHVGRSP
jgi:MATE family multidrug resistance protein